MPSASIGFKDVDIAASATDSAAIDLGGGIIIGFIMPAALTSTTMTFTGCDTVDGTFKALYDTAGNAISVTVAASRYITVNSGSFVPVNFIKLVMGSSEAAARVIRLVLG